MRLRKGTPSVTISGPIGECVLYVYGRKDVAGVDSTDRPTPWRRSPPPRSDSERGAR